MSSHNPYFALTFASGLFTSQVSWAKPNVLATIQQQAQLLNLAEHKQWQVLLHYQNTDSLITDKNFFFIPMEQKSLKPN